VLSSTIFSLAVDWVMVRVANGDGCQYRTEMDGW
jgi:hypothetical protein